MSELSPAAKAVDDAFWKTIYNKWNIYDMRRAQLAAALRAAVKFTRKKKMMKTLGVTMAKSQAYCLESDLLTIADELDHE